MRLVKLDVAGFGTLSDFHMDFNEGVTTIKWDNGEGKSTLCEFIAALLYGMDSTKANDKELYARAHYLPFGGGKYGGSLEFIHTGDGDEKIVRIERFFDDKTVTRDTLKVFVDGEDTVIKEEPGITFFGVGKETFRKLLYLNPFNMTPSGNSEINSMIGGLDADDAKAFSRAKDDIDKARTELKPKVNRAGTLSRIPTLESEINALKIKKREIESKKKELPEKYGKREKILSDIKDAETALSDISKRERLLEKWAEYDRRAAELSAREERLEKLAVDYPKGLPKSGDIDGLLEAVSSVRVNSEIIKALGTGIEDKERLSNISFSCRKARDSVYGDGSAFGVDFEKLTKDIAFAEDLASESRSREENLRRGALSSSGAELAGRFSGREAEAQELLDDLSKLKKTADDAEAAYREALQENERRNEKKRRSLTAKAILGAVFLTLGVVLAAAGILVDVLGIAGKTVAFVLIAVGAAIGVIGAVLFIVRGLSKRSGDSDGGLLALEKAFERSKQDLNRRLSEFGEEYLEEHGQVLFAEHFESYKRLREAELEERKEIDSIKKEEAEKRGIIEEFFRIFVIFGFLEDLRSALEDLKEIKNEYEQLTEKLKKEEDAERKIGAAREKIAEFRNRFTPWKDLRELEGDPGSVRTDVLLISGLEAEIAGEKNRLAGFKTGLGDSERPEPVPPGTEQYLKERLEDLDNRLKETEIEIMAAESVAGELGDCEARIREAEEKLADANIFYAELCTAYSLIEKAEKQLKDRHIGPVSKRFEAYRENLSAAVGAEVRLRSDFTVEFEKNGAIRSQDHLSTGQLACVALCVKMALAEGVIGEDRCFFILDDPFMSLSNKNLDAVKELIKKIGEKRQVIYLTCSKERMI